MSLVIFFGFAFLVFIAGLVAIGLAFYNWILTSRKKKENQLL